MAHITTRETLDEAPQIPASSTPSTPSAPAEADAPAPQWSVTRAITLAKCLRCGFEWLPRVENPARCPHCKSVLWNVERAQRLPGKPAPTRKGKPRGKAFSSDYNPRSVRSKNP